MAHKLLNDRIQLTNLRDNILGRYHRDHQHFLNLGLYSAKKKVIKIKIMRSETISPKHIIILTIDQEDNSTR